MTAGRLESTEVEDGAFTLIEILIVMAVLAILAGIGFSVMSGVKERAHRSRTRGELAVIAQSLEHYRAHYGDYPWIEEGSTGENELYAALIGHRSPTGALERRSNGQLVNGRDRLVDKKGKHFIEPAQLSTFLKIDPVADISNGGESATLDRGYRENHLIDPWGSPYLYAYRKTIQGSGDGRWTRAGYILMSRGPDGEAGFSVPMDGELNRAMREDALARDNLYATTN